MSIIRHLLIFFLVTITTVHAEEVPLNVGITHFLPPYVMQGAHNESYGFDIEMMDSLCKIMKRHCVFHTMQFDQLIPAVTDRKIDVAVSFLTITQERIQLVNFSIPYLLSHSRFLSKHPPTEGLEPFNVNLLNGKKIGVVSGTIFYDHIKAMNIESPKIKLYPTNTSLIEALNSDEVEFVLVNQQAALYWEANSSGALHPIGSPYIYGYGVGIAVNKNNPVLLSEINKALLEYQNSDDFKHNYDKFIRQF
ncbi:transporter substrate-binding domain-containing protein [Legionella fallonii]|uniref:Arginine ABC transporter, periplasmic binding protein n=1 Tax=Legionella fallonii LLAP-10 TaxID=1212491 RepID=A0A098G3L3_9GAMM|nr:transporter substrate-binding domain-containing protein [Legionella fallonii]CEG56561.1 Arginine ABC transporter, periplasmic binding protein [Legionella fallonii LLAP-10]